MTFKDIPIKPSYETLSEDPLKDFYVPVLEESISYDRIAGYFSSTSLAIAARGIAGLINNVGHMRLIVSPNLSREDYEAICTSSDNPELYIERMMLESLAEIKQTLRDDHVRALGWMLASGLLEMKIAYLLDDDEETAGALFHQKVGILCDCTGNSLSFSGSINETATGWLKNSEEFKVFCEWKAGQEVFYAADKAKFESFWNDRRPYVKMLSPSPSFVTEFEKLGEDFDADSLTLKRYLKEQQREEAKERIPLFPYQAEAVDAWESHDHRLLFEMATGTGKTRTAIACINLAMEEYDKFVCIVAAPEITLARQWKGEFDRLGVKFDSVVFADGSSGGQKKWAPAIRRAITRIDAGISANMLVLVTHASACTSSFTQLFDNTSSSLTICFVGDEVHGMGAPKQRRALLDRYDLRIGLSATPTRWFDDYGTKILVDYFGNDSFVFSIRDAQLTVNPLTGHPFLTPYRYQVEYVCLGDDEMDDYIELSARISKLSFMTDDAETQELYERLLMKRADIMKNAAAKLPAFEGLIRSMGYVEKTLVFTSPQQINDVVRILAANRVCAHPFTEKQGTRKLREYDGLSERERLIQEFKFGGYQALVAITCLDEGIDIPIAEKAILLSNSTNPREYIQRIGRVIRYHATKDMALIVDFVVEPDWSRLEEPVMIEFERKAFEKELRRVREMAENADNGIDVILSINRKLERLYGI